MSLEFYIRAKNCKFQCNDNFHTLYSNFFILDKTFFELDKKCVYKIIPDGVEYLIYEFEENFKTNTLVEYNGKDYLLIKVENDKFKIQELSDELLLPARLKINQLVNIKDDVYYTTKQTYKGTYGRKLLNVVKNSKTFDEIHDKNFKIKRIFHAYINTILFDPHSQLNLDSKPVKDDRYVYHPSEIYNLTKRDFNDEKDFFKKNFGDIPLNIYDYYTINSYILFYCEKLSFTTMFFFVTGNL